MTGYDYVNKGKTLNEDIYDLFTWMNEETLKEYKFIRKLEVYNYCVFIRGHLDENDGFDIIINREQNYPIRIYASERENDKLRIRLEYLLQNEGLFGIKLEETNLEEVKG